MAQEYEEYTERGGSRGTSWGGRKGWGQKVWRRGAGPEYEEYIDRGGSRGTSPGGRDAGDGGLEAGHRAGVRGVHG